MTEGVSIETLVKAAGELTTLPQVAIRVNQMADDPDVSAAEIGKVISHDPALTIRLLRIANSPFYGLTSKVDSVDRAVTLLGSKKIRNMVMATAVAGVFADLSNELVSMENFWHHSLYCALAAQHLAEASRHKVQSDVVFIAALLHDVGDLLIFNQLPEKGREALLYSVEGPEGTEVYQAEREIIGFDHAQLGAEMARQWQLPEVLRECIEFHHEPVRAEKFPVETAIVHIANSLAYLAELDSDDEYEAARIDERAWEVAGLDKALGAEAVAAARTQIGEVRAVFFPEQQH